MAAVTLEDVKNRLKKMRFRHRLFGGVDEDDVWKQITLLDQDYQNLYRILHMKYKKLLAQSVQKAGNQLPKKHEA